MQISFFRKEFTIRIDHIAYRVADRKKTSAFFISSFGYKIQQEFQIVFDDGTTAECIALEPPEKTANGVSWTINPDGQEYHLPPEIFVSDGPLGSIVGDWVAARNGVGGIHHIAYQVENVEETVREWREKGYAEFTSEPIKCPEDNLIQVFTKPSSLTGVIYEFIERGEFGFCRTSVKKLMESTKSIL